MSYQRLVFQMMMITKHNSLHHKNVLYKRKLLPLSMRNMVVIRVLNFILGIGMSITMDVCYQGTLRSHQQYHDTPMTLVQPISIQGTYPT